MTKRRIVLFMWDAMDPRYLDGRARMPYLNRLISQGAFFPKMPVVYPSVTNVSWASMVTGAWPKTTGNIAYAWDPVADEAFGLNRKYRAENLVQSFARAGLSSGSVGMFMFLNKGLFWQDDPNSEKALYLQPESHDPTHRMDYAIQFMSGKFGYVPDFLTVYTAILDKLGHEGGPNNPEIVSALEQLDTELGRFMDVLEGRGLLEETVIGVVADHGMSPAGETLRSSVTQAFEESGIKLKWLSTKNRESHSGADLVAVTSGRAALIGFPAEHQSQDKVVEILKKVPHIKQVFTSPELETFHVHPWFKPIVVEAEVPYSFFDGSPMGVRGTHGSSLEMAAPFILAGPGVQPGVYNIGRSVDIAPTLSALMGVSPPQQCEGEALEILDTGGEVQLGQQRAL